MRADFAAAFATAVAVAVAFARTSRIGAAGKGERRDGGGREEEGEEKSCFHVGCSKKMQLKGDKNIEGEKAH